MYRTNGHKNTRHFKNNGQLVGSDPQCALCQYIILTSKAPNLIHHKMQYLESPHCLPSYEGL